MATRMTKPEMKKKQSNSMSHRSPNRATDAATRKADEAAKAKVEEHRTALQGKGEQGKSSLGSIPSDEEEGS
jgi:hypothetical protein